MSYEKLEMLIDGEWTQGTGTVREQVFNPATEEVLGEVPHASAEDLDRALAASEKGFQVWKSKTAVERQSIMEKAARLLEERKEAIARTCTLEMGKPLAESLVEIGFVIEMTRWYGEEGKRLYGRLVPPRIPGTRQMVTKEPVGPVAAFVAWNFPGTNVIRKVAGAVGAGCSIIIKASEETPGTCIAIARAYHDAGVPAGVINVVFGVPAEVSEHVLGSRIPKKLSFTGSVPVGVHLQKLAAETMKRCTMELGGHAPYIVFDDAGIDAAAKVAAGFKFRNAGQVCISPSRFFVQRKVHDQFVEKLVAATNAIKVGNGLEDGVQMGPLIAPRRIEVMERFVEDATSRGATVETGGERMGNQGWFFAPTVLTNVPDDASIMNDEPFGPLAPVAAFDEVDEVIARANSVDVGLASYAFTTSGSLAKEVSERLDTGMVGINHPGVSTPETPFGGVNDSGYGSEGGTEGLDAYLRTKFVTEMGV